MIQHKRSKKHYALLFLLPAALFFVMSVQARFAEANELRNALDKGVGLYEKGDFGSAVQVFKEIIAEWKEKAEGEEGKEALFTANLYIGMSYLGMGKESVAKDSFRQA